MRNKFIITGAIVFSLLTYQYISNKYLDAVKNESVKAEYKDSYDIVRFEKSVLIYTFEGSGGFIRGGVLPVNEKTDELLAADEISFDELQKHFTAELETESFRDPLVYWGNYDGDAQIEIFIVDVFGTAFGGPFQLNDNGTLSEEPSLKIFLMILSLRIYILAVYGAAAVMILFVLKKL